MKKHKLTKAQEKIVKELRNGSLLHISLGFNGDAWLSNHYGRVNLKTALALRDHNVVIDCSTEKTPWYRKDYRLSEEYK